MRLLISLGAAAALVFAGAVQASADGGVPTLSFESSAACEAWLGEHQDELSSEASGRIAADCFDLFTQELGDPLASLHASPSAADPVPLAGVRISVDPPTAVPLRDPARVSAWTISPPWFRDSLTGVFIHSVPGDCYEYQYGDSASLWFVPETRSGQLVFSYGVRCRVDGVYKANVDLRQIEPGRYRDSRSGAVLSAPACAGLDGTALVLDSVIVTATTVCER